MLYYGHPFVLYIKFTNQTYRSVYEFPEFAEYGKLISFAFVIVVATTDDLGIDVKAFGNGDDELLNRQGQTTVVNGNCGPSAAPAGEKFC